MKYEITSNRTTQTAPDGEPTIVIQNSGRITS